MNHFLAIQDKISGTKIHNTYRFLKDSEYWTRQQLEDYRLRKLIKLIDRAYKYVPYYQILFKKNNILPGDIKALEDIQKIPILTKEIAKREAQNLLSTNININSRKIKRGKTGGTTGAPLPFYKDVSTRNFTWGAFYRWYDWMGIRQNDNIIILWGDSKVLSKDYKSILKNTIRSFSSNTQLISTFNLNDKSIPHIVGKIIKHKPVLIRGYLSSILYIGKYLTTNNIKIPSLKAVSTTTETLLPIYREFIHKAYGVSVFDQYGCGECGSVAFECAQHNGLHITEEHTIVEVIDEEGHQVFNRPGRIVLTDLDNYVMPFIRYENGDLASHSKDKCLCGINSSLLTRIDGRSVDTIVLKNGSAVHGVFFTDILYEMKNKEVYNIHRFQIYQKRAGEIEFRIETHNDFLNPRFIDNLQDILNQYFSRADIRIHKKLSPDKSGKFRYILSELN